MKSMMKLIEIGRFGRGATNYMVSKNIISAKKYLEEEGFKPCEERHNKGLFERILKEEMQYAKIKDINVV